MDIDLDIEKWQTLPKANNTEPSLLSLPTVRLKIISFICYVLTFVYMQYILLRSTKWNANLILLCDYAELVALCKVIVWKTHIPVRTQK